MPGLPLAPEPWPKPVDVVRDMLRLRLRPAYCQAPAQRESPATSGADFRAGLSNWCFAGAAAVEAHMKIKAPFRLEKKRKGKMHANAANRTIDRLWLVAKP